MAVQIRWLQESAKNRSLGGWMVLQIPVPQPIQPAVTLQFPCRQAEHAVTGYILLAGKQDTRSRSVTLLALRSKYTFA